MPALQPLHPPVPAQEALVVALHHALLESTKGTFLLEDLPFAFKQKTHKNLEDEIERIGFVGSVLDLLMAEPHRFTVGGEPGEPKVRANRENAPRQQKPGAVRKPGKHAEATGDGALLDACREAEERNEEIELELRELLRCLDTLGTGEAQKKENELRDLRSQRAKLDTEILHLQHKVDLAEQTGGQREMQQGWLGEVS
jgi:hypothetical protein